MQDLCQIDECRKLSNDAICEQVLKCTCSLQRIPSHDVCAAEFDLDVIEVPHEYAFRVGELKNLFQYSKEDFHDKTVHAFVSGN